MPPRPQAPATPSANRKAITKHVRAMKRIVVDVRSIEDKVERLQQQLAVALEDLVRSQGLSSDEVLFAPQKARMARRAQGKRTTRRGSTRARARAS